MNKTLTDAERATIMDACQSISRNADGLKEGCTIEGEWQFAEDKAWYDAEMKLLGRLTALLATQQPEPRTCAARKQGSAGGNDPAECNWPMCDCDEHATKVIAALQECDALKSPGEFSMTVEDAMRIVMANWCDKDAIERVFRANLMRLEPLAEAAEEQPSLTNPLTPYGMLCRALRIVAGTTLMDMAQHLGRGPAELSSIEFGRRPVRDADIVDAAHFFACVGIQSTTHALTIAARAGEAS